MGGREVLDGSSDSESDDVPEIIINAEFARRYEHNKQREDLQRYEELKKKRGLQNSDSDDSESSSSEDEDLANSMKFDLEFLEALSKLKNRDPSLKNKDIELFKPDGAENSTRVKGDGNTKKKKKKKMYLKDVVAKHLIEDGPELAEEDDNTVKQSGAKIYDEEQEQTRREFLSAVAREEDDDDEFIRVKDNNADDHDDGHDSVDDEYDKKLNEVFPDSDEKASFLRDFLKKEMWREDKQSQGSVREEDLEMVSEDEMEIERQEEYEHRFQENVGDRILGHSRQVEGSVRKKVKARKEQRKSKEERTEIARLEREEELRHLKNLKKKENDGRIRKIMEIAGIKEAEEGSFDPKELEKEFDPQEYDRMMKKAFGDQYYVAEDAGFEVCSDMDEDGGDIGKPDFDKEDELLGLPKGWDSVGSGDGFLAAREKVLKLKEENVGDLTEEEEEEEEDEETKEEKVSDEDKQEKKRKFALLERAKKEMMEEYYKLDYEDTIGDMKTRFRYAKIKPNRFGLTSAEILMMDEKELNEYVSLKKLAPYTDKEWKVPNNKRNEIKQKAKEIFRQGKKGSKKNGKKLRRIDDAKDSNSSTGAAERGKEHAGVSNVDTSKLSRSARRRQTKAARKLPDPRLKAYGLTMPVKSKNKGKH